MDDLIRAAILGVIEGITEFLPISSTGHLIVGTSLLNFPIPEDFRSTFEIFIQFGAVLAVVLYYSRQLWEQFRKIPSDRKTQMFWFNVAIAFLPAAVVGFLFRDPIKAALYNPVVVAVALIVGGIVLIVIEGMPKKPVSDTQSLEQITTRQAILIGLAQLTALIPGVSRSGASIIGGLLIGLNRPVATAFSFYLAIPTLGIATLYELFSAVRDGIVQAEQLPILGVGTVVSFFVALAAIAWLLRYVATHDFRAFGVYRIIAGIVILLLVAAGVARV
jgi:undecaprenyl-diphosphatase